MQSGYRALCLTCPAGKQPESAPDVQQNTLLPSWQQLEFKAAAVQGKGGASMHIALVAAISSLSKVVSGAFVSETSFACSVEQIM